MNEPTLEDLVLIHRYLYYVLAKPVLSDYAYDDIERKARSIYPEDSVVHKIGSSNPWDYSEKIKKYAEGLINE